MYVGVVQLSSTLDLQRNLHTAAWLVERAVSSGAQLVVLPEVYNRRGGGARDWAEALDGESATWAAELAQKHRIWLLAGSMIEKAEGHFHNTSLLFNGHGERVAQYRKIHLFDVDVPGAQNRESDNITAGTQIVTAGLGEGLTLGMTVCYDLRFPELYSRLTQLGARIIAVPSAFTERTGRDHWEILLRARAIENQVFLLAANQFGTTPGTPTSFGRSMIIDPWGTVLAQVPDQEGVAVTWLDFERQAETRAKLPSLQHRRPDLY